MQGIVGMRVSSYSTLRKGGLGMRLQRILVFFDHCRMQGIVGVRVSSYSTLRKNIWFL